jgi:hypothetical protein
MKRPLTVGCVGASDRIAKEGLITGGRVAEATAVHASVLIKGLITNGRVRTLHLVAKKGLITNGRVTAGKERAINDRGITEAVTGRRPPLVS